jgi:hypothetical protein
VVAVQASHIVDPVTPHQKLRALMLTARHRMQIIPILMNALTLSSPQMVLGEEQDRPILQSFTPAAGILVGVLKERSEDPDAQTGCFHYPL